MTRKNLVMLTVLSAMLGGCSGLPLTYGGYGGGSGALVCDDLGADADAQKIEAFLTTATRFERETNALADDVEATCAAMASDLGIAVPRATEGSLQVDATCSAVAAEIDAIVEASLPRDATLEVAYDAPVCTVSLDAMASCVARCDADLSASSEVTCEENVVGRSCWGDSEARADAQCEAACEAQIDLRAECTEPSVTVVAGVSIDPEAQARLDALVVTLDANYPRFAALEARLNAVAESGAELVDTFEGAASATGRLGLNAMACFAEASASTAQAMSTVQVTVSVTVEVSASVNAG
ncbi:MAG: hypothetical protein H6719_21955 [Sandaracinaceae bacterium]|nr:hypothetical protein [Sandaracinaceae bacterium]